MIIVASYESDMHATYILRKAESAGIKAVLWDISKFPSESEISFSIFPFESKSMPSIVVGNQTLQREDVKGVFWRRPHGVFQKKKFAGLGEYMRLESEVVVSSLFDFFPNANWISTPDSTRLACRKPVQLEVARSIGLKIPMTCISNSPSEVAIFIEKLGDRLLTMKPVGTAFMGIAPSGRVDSSENKVVFTKITSKKTVLENIQMVKNCPVIFQEAIIKDYDIRVTVVDDKVFAAAVSLDGCNDPTNLDWRNYEGRRIYKTHKLTKSVELLCAELNSRLGIRFGCIDLAYSKKEGYTFFEVNPQGQWLPSEQKLGYDISGAVLNALQHQDDIPS